MPETVERNDAHTSQVDQASKFVIADMVERKRHAERLAATCGGPVPCKYEAAGVVDVAIRKFEFCLIHPVRRRRSIVLGARRIERGVPKADTKC